MIIHFHIHSFTKSQTVLWNKTGEIDSLTTKKPTTLAKRAAASRCNLVELERGLWLNSSDGQRPCAHASGHHQGCRWTSRTPSIVLLILLPALPPPDTWWQTLETLKRGVPEAECENSGAHTK